MRSKLVERLSAVFHSLSLISILLCVCSYVMQNILLSPTRVESTLVSDKSSTVYSVDPVGQLARPDLQYIGGRDADEIFWYYLSLVVMPYFANVPQYRNFELPFGL